MLVLLYDGTFNTTELGQQKTIVLDTQVTSGKVKKEDILDNLFKYFNSSQNILLCIEAMLDWVVSFDKFKFIKPTPSKYLPL